MQGSVRKRGSMWSYSFDMGTVGGKRQRKEKGGFRTKKEAEAALAKAISEYNNPNAPRLKTGCAMGQSISMCILKICL